MQFPEGLEDSSFKSFDLSFIKNNFNNSRDFFLWEYRIGPTSFIKCCIQKLKSFRICLSEDNFGFNSQIRKQMSGPDLHVFTLKLLSLKKILWKGYYATCQCRRYSVFKKIWKKNWPSPYYFTAQPSPNHSPQPRIDSSYLEVSGLDICGLSLVQIYN